MAADRGRPGRLRGVAGRRARRHTACRPHRPALRPRRPGRPHHPPGVRARVRRPRAGSATTGLEPGRRSPPGRWRPATPCCSTPPTGKRQREPSSDDDARRARREPKPRSATNARRPTGGPGDRRRGVARRWRDACPPGVRAGLHAAGAGPLLLGALPQEGVAAPPDARCGSPRRCQRGSPAARSPCTSARRAAPAAWASSDAKAVGPSWPGSGGVVPILTADEPVAVEDLATR